MEVARSSYAVSWKVGEQSHLGLARLGAAKSLWSGDISSVSLVHDNLSFPVPMIFYFAETLNELVHLTRNKRLTGWEMEQYSRPRFQDISRLD